MNLIFQENEREANLYSCRCLQVMALIAALAWGLNLLDVFIVPSAVMNAGMPVCILSFLLPTMLRSRMPQIGGGFKYLIMGCCILGITVLSIAIPKHTVLAWIAPVLLSCHYYSRTLTVSALIASVVWLYVAGIASLFVGEGDPNLIKAFHAEEAGITPETFREAVLFFSAAPSPNPDRDGLCMYYCGQAHPQPAGKAGCGFLCSAADRDRAECSHSDSGRHAAADFPCFP